jgi:peroxiredoxin
MRMHDRRPARANSVGLPRNAPGRMRGLRRCRAALGLLAILALTLAAAPTSHEPASLGLEMPKELVEAPDFSLPDVTGRMVRLKGFRGTVMFMNFFATWCVPCREEMPAMERLHRTYKDRGLVVLAVDIREGAKTVRAFTQELKLSFPALLDKDGSVAYAYGIRPVPATYLVGRDGKILWRAFGSREWGSGSARQYFASLLVGQTR